MAIPKRIGVLVPSTNQVVEPDFNMMVPKGVTVHAERIWLEGPSAPGGGDGAELEEMNSDVERAAKYLASAGVDVITYNCTSGTYRTGNISTSHDISRLINKTTNVPTITAVEASIAALKHMDAHRLSIAGPYGNFLLQQRLTPLLEHEGFEVLNAEGEPEMQQRTHSSVIGNQDPEVILNFVPKVTVLEADCVYLPGTAWRAVEVVEELERRVGKPVITVNQATLWMALRMLDLKEPILGFGTLLTNLPAT